MTFSELARWYIACRLVSPSHAADVLSVCRRADNAVTDIGNKCALTDWLRRELATKAPATVAKYRRVILGVMRAAQDAGLCAAPKLPPVRLPRQIPTAWTVADVSAILNEAVSLPGLVGDVLAADWWPALVLTVYWTAARIGSILEAVPADWDGQFLMLRRTKNGSPAVYRLHQQAVEAIAKIVDPHAPRLFVWPHSRWYLFRSFRRIVEAAGVSAPKRGCNLFHRLRRTCLSYCWAVDPAIAQRQADHASGRTTLMHYVDPRLVGDGRSAADVLPVPEVRRDRQLRLFTQKRA